jgi:hypothetical protein
MTTTTETRDLPVGTPVRYWTGYREGDGKVSRTRTIVQPLGGEGGTLVVWVEGEGSCIAMTHVQEITEAELAAEVKRREETRPEPVMCGNPDHEEYGSGPVKAVARVSWPSGRFRPTTSCKTDLRRQVNEAIREGRSIHIDMIEESHR